MASGYTNSHPRDTGDFYFETRFYWESSYDASTNTSTVSFRPQIRTTVNMGNDLRMFNSKDNGGGIYRDGSKIYGFPTYFSSGNYLRTWSNPYNDWVGLFAQGDAFPSLTVRHDNSGNASIKLGLRGGVISMNDYSGAYSSWLDDGYYINISQSRTLNVSYNANGGSGAPGATYFYGSTESIVLSSTKPTRTGYTFLGWATSSTATTATYSAGQNIGTRSSSLTLYAVWEKKTFELSISEGTGSNIVVKRGSTTLSDGALITYGDELTITFTTTSGYNLETHTVNGVSFTSGGTLTVTSDTSVVSTARLKTFTLTILQGANSSIAVMRENEVLSNGATITYGDELTISFSSPPEYELSAHTVNGSTFASGGKHTVTGAVSVSSAAALKTYELSISEGTGSSIVVKRGSTTLSDGATITYGDELTITFSALTGYNLGTHTVNGSAFTSGGKHTVTAAVSVVSTAALKTFLLSISAERGANVLVKNGSSTLSDGATITYGDVIEITVTAAVGYLLREVTLNDGELVSPAVVKADIRIEATAIPAGANIAAGEENIPYQFAIDTGSAYEIFIPVLDNGQSWELY